MNSSSQSRYRQLAEQLPLPLYFRPYWLDAVIGPEGWDVALAFDRGGHITGVWVYCLSTYYGFRVVKMPPLTAYSGPRLFYPSNMTAQESRYTFEKKVLNELIEQLPPTAFFYQEWHPDLHNGLPAHWKGFRQTTRYTYLLSDLHDSNAVFDNFRSNVRTHIRKAEDLLVVESDDIEAVFRLHVLSLEKQGLPTPATLPVLQRIDETLHARRQRLLLLAEDEQGRRHAGIYVVWDEKTAYYLLSGADPGLRSSGALYRLVWEALQFCSRKGLSFDFEGSMLEPVEEVFRGFGGQLIQHHKVFRPGNRVFGMLWEWKGWGR